MLFLNLIILTVLMCIVWCTVPSTVRSPFCIVAISWFLVVLSVCGITHPWLSCPQCVIELEWLIATSFFRDVGVPVNWVPIEGKQTVYSRIVRNLNVHIDASMPWKTRSISCEILHWPSNTKQIFRMRSLKRTALFHEFLPVNRLHINVRAFILLSWPRSIRKWSIRFLLIVVPSVNWVDVHIWPHNMELT